MGGVTDSRLVETMHPCGVGDKFHLSWQGWGGKCSGMSGTPCY